MQLTTVIMVQSMNQLAGECATIAGMALPKDYAGEVCSLARALEVVGERWTLLIVRDAFFGVRRFSDFAAHLDIPRAVLTHRLAALVESDVLAVVPGAHGHDEYVLTAKGLDLWPVVRSLLSWGDDHYSAAGPRRLFRHALDNAEVTLDGVCAACGALVPVADLVVIPGPGWVPRAKTDVASVALRAPHRLLTSVRNS
jgi:DNA-binding HxlR family transcriptional regulator